MSDHTTKEELEEQLARALRIIAELTNLAKRVAAATLELEGAAAISRDDQRMEDKGPVDGVMPMIGYGPPGTIGQAFATNRLLTAAIGGCSHERIKRCRGEAATNAWVTEVAAEMNAGVTAWSRAFHRQNIYIKAHGRLTCCLVFNNGDMRVLCDRVIGPLFRRFRGPRAPDDAKRS